MYYVYMGSVLLPIAPEKLTLKVKNQNKTITLINEGEVNLLKDAGLTDVEFDVLLPAVQYSFATYEYGFKRISYFLDHFEELKTSKKPFEFKVIRQMPDGKLLFDTNMTVSLETYTPTENANEGFDSKVSIKLKQYKHFGTKLVKVSNDNATATVEKQRETTNSPEPKKETTYTVQKGDCLWNIAKKFYGNGSSWSAIYEANKDKIKNPNLIQVGQVLKIPNASDVKTTTVTTQTSSDKKPTTSNSGGKKPTTTTSGCKLTINNVGEPHVGGEVTVAYYDVNKKYMFATIHLSPTVLTIAEGTTATVSIKPNLAGFTFSVSTIGTWSKTDKLTQGSAYTCAGDKAECSITIKWKRAW